MSTLGLDPVVASAILAILAYLLQFAGSTIFSYIATQKDRRQLRNTHELERIDFQLGQVFGKLRGLLLTSKAAFSTLIKRWQMEDAVPKFIQLVSTPPADNTPTPIQQDWMLWIEHILQPTNREVCDVVLHHSSGFDTMPGFLANIVAHTKEWEVILAKWKSGDFSHMNTTLPFEDRINDFVFHEYDRLRARKRQILHAMEQVHEQETTANLWGDDDAITLQGERRDDATKVRVASQPLAA